MTASVASAPYVKQAAAAADSLVTGTSTTLSVFGVNTASGADYDADNDSNLTYTWAATMLPPGATAPAFTVAGSENGTNAAKNATVTFTSAGAYWLTVTLENTVTNKSTTSSVAVTVAQTATIAEGVAITPASASLHAGETLQFTATGVDQFGNDLDASARTRDYLRMAVDLLSPDRVAVEFRHASWVAPDELPRTTALLEELGAAYVCVDEPRIVSPTVLPPLALCTTPALGYVRLHGRNAATWNARAQSAAERFRYQYTVDELEEWVAPIVWLAKRATATYVLFNNCYGDYAPQNARQMMSLLDLLRE